MSKKEAIQTISPAGHGGSLVTVVSPPFQKWKVSEKASGAAKTS